MATYVLVHGAWHTGRGLEPVAASIAAAGHTVFTPTTKGNRPGDSKTIGLSEAIRSIVDYLAVSDLKEIILVGHSYGGMIITGVADKMPHRIRRLVYWNTFVPNNDESVSDMLPPEYIALLDAIASERGDGSVVLPFPVWREAFINDADLDTAKRAYELLNPHPLKILTDKISLVTNPAEMKLAKSYLNCTRTLRCHTTIRGTPGCHRNSGCFGSCRCQVVKSFVSPTRCDWRRRSWPQAATSIISSYAASACSASKR